MCIINLQQQKMFFLYFSANDSTSNSDKTHHRTKAVATCSDIKPDFAKLPGNLVSENSRNKAASDDNEACVLGKYPLYCLQWPFPGIVFLLRLCVSCWWLLAAATATLCCLASWAAKAWCRNRPCCATEGWCKRDWRDIFWILYYGKCEIAYF